MLTQLLLQGENEELEFKTSFGREVMETLVAFANSKGGRLLVGVSNTRIIVGVSVSEETLQQWINQIKSITSPSIVPDAEVLKHEGKDVVMLWVPAYPVKPVSIKGKYFIRKYASNHLMSLEEIANEHLKTINLSWDFAVDPHHELGDISLDKINRFVELANVIRDRPITDDPLTILRKFELMRNQSVTFGCFLLFCNEPPLSTTIDAGRFDSETLIKDSLTIREDLFSEVETSLEFVRKHTNKRFVITGKAQRDEVWEYPLAAVREIILNMIVHRDYRASADSTIKIFHDRIEVFNPGTLPAGMTLEEILSGRSASSPRNKLIAAIFKEAGLIEKYGSGIKRVCTIMLAAGANKPVFEIIGNFFKVTLFPGSHNKSGGVNGEVSTETGKSGGVNGGISTETGESGGVNGGVSTETGKSGGVNYGERGTNSLAFLLQFIINNPGKKSGEIRSSLDLPQRTMERWMKQLRDEGAIEFRGAPKTGGYFPTDSTLAASEKSDQD